jgi:hypothetical protein
MAAMPDTVNALIDRRSGGVQPDAGSVRPRTAADVKAVLEAERAGVAFVVFRDGEGTQVVRVLDVDRPLLTLGRHSACDVAIAWDAKVSGTHAVLERLGPTWTLADDGISRNGTYLNGARLSTRQRLVDGDAIRIGSTLVTFRLPLEGSIAATSTAASAVIATLTPMQRKVLIALCRPYKHAGPYATPASNSDIAAELVLSVDATKTHMRGLFERFGIGDLPQNQKRARVVELAFRAGVVTERDL